MVLADDDLLHFEGDSFQFSSGGLVLGCHRSIVSGKSEFALARRSKDLSGPVYLDLNWHRLLWVQCGYLL